VIVVIEIVAMVAMVVATALHHTHHRRHHRPPHHVAWPGVRLRWLCCTGGIFTRPRATRTSPRGSGHRPSPSTHSV
jgi:hypothetical protein